MRLKKADLKDFLDEKALQYNQPKFIEDDPIQIPHRYSVKEDIEIAAFLTAIISWGNRKMIIKNASKMMDLMGNAPHDFVMNHSHNDLSTLDGFVHRTFNDIDFKQFILSLHHIYKNHGGLEQVLQIEDGRNDYREAIHHLKSVFFEIPHPQRTMKHISDPLKNSTAKRINMFLRWMVRTDQTGVDFGIWKSHHPAHLSCPLDVHSGNVARKLGLLKRKQNDWKAVQELDKNLRKFNPQDPVVYDFALFGLGVFENF
ncbi:MAG: TIGR02757 family protein [Flavobacteriaceae bacterium]|nr:TIGR02757 family protein [Flavobacteriaceae bacterium]|tara:strand:- start:219655 stop:220425 length:771 start_codon:yes stop_codon:yes gene_type:complete